MKNRFFAVPLLALALLACGPLKYQVNSSSKAPGADAKLTADIRQLQNVTQIEFTAKFLPPPGRVASGSTVYTAWYRENSHKNWMRLGGLEYDEGDREAELKGSVPVLAFDFQVTAEVDHQAESPSADVIFNQRVQDDD